MSKVRWGILGAANIGRRVIPAIHAAHNAEVVGVASRSVERASTYASELGIPHVFESYEALIASDSIDAIYNPLPNGEHAKWSIACAKAGKPCLCEKPLARDAAEAQTMVTAFEEAQVLLAEAFMYRFHPQHAIVKQLLEDGAIGKVQMVSAAFTFSIENENDIRLLPNQGGGGLLDVGCYCLDALRLVLGEEVSGGFAQATFHAHSGVDEMLSALIQFPSGIQGHFDCGFRASLAEYYELRGTEGRIRVEPAFVPHPEHETQIHYWKGQNQLDYQPVTVPAANQYVLMIEEFSAALLEKRAFRFPVQSAVSNLRVMDNLLASAHKQRFLNF